MALSTNIRDFLNPESTPEIIAAAYNQYVGQDGGQDNTQTQDNARAALRNIGISEATIEKSYQGYVSSLQKQTYSDPANVPVASQFSGVTTQMSQAGVSQEEINAFLLAEQAKADAFDAQFREQQALADAQAQAAIYRDNQTFAQAQAEIAAQIAAEQARMAQQRADYESQIAAQQQAAAAAEAQARAEQERIAAQIAETNRIAAEMARRNKEEMEAMQRTSAAKIAAGRKAGRTAADRSLLSGFGATPDMPSMLGVQGSMGGGSSLGASGTLGVG
jgi:hypothetical protein